jgi:nicotinamidase-related amidase
MSSQTELLRPETTTLIVIDVQEKLLPAVWENERVVGNITRLLHLARILGVKMLPTTQYQHGLGPTVTEVAGLLPESPLDKTSFGCLGDPRIRERLQSAAKPGEALLVAGIETHICVMQTVLGALGEGYQVHVASDATSSRSPRNFELGLERMRSAGAVISSTEMAIYELIRRADTAAFKQMLPYLK